MIIFIVSLVSHQKDIFEKFYGTPHKLDFRAISKMFGIEYHRPESINSFENMKASYGSPLETILIDEYVRLKGNRPLLSQNS